MPIPALTGDLAARKRTLTSPQHSAEMVMLLVCLFAAFSRARILVHREAELESRSPPEVEKPSLDCQLPAAPEPEPESARPEAHPPDMLRLAPHWAAGFARRLVDSSLRRALLPLPRNHRNTSFSPPASFATRPLDSAGAVLSQNSSHFLRSSPRYHGSHRSAASPDSKSPPHPELQPRRPAPRPPFRLRPCRRLCRALAARGSAGLGWLAASRPRFALRSARASRLAALWGSHFFSSRLVEEGLFRCYSLSHAHPRNQFLVGACRADRLCLYLALTGGGNGVWGVYLPPLSVSSLASCSTKRPTRLARSAFWQAAWVTSTFFGFYHTANNGENWIGIFAAAFIGFVFCVSVRVTGSAWWAIGCHAAWDWAETFFYGTADSGCQGQGHFLSANSGRQSTLERRRRRPRRQPARPRRHPPAASLLACIYGRNKLRVANPPPTSSRQPDRWSAIAPSQRIGRAYPVADRCLNRPQQIHRAPLPRRHRNRKRASGREFSSGLRPPCSVFLLLAAG